jgi:hypothetical protein
MNYQSATAQERSYPAMDARSRLIDWAVKKLHHGRERKLLPEHQDRVYGACMWWAEQNGFGGPEIDKAYCEILGKEATEREGKS